MIVAAILGLLFSPVAARASIVPVFDITPLTAEQAKVTLTLNVSSDPGFFNARFVGGVVGLNSGDGDFEVFFVAPGLTSQTFSAVFDYTSGAFQPSFGYAVGYSEQFKVGRLTFTVPQFGAGSGEGGVTFAAAAVPEASTWVMMLLGFAAVGFAMFRRGETKLQSV